MEQPDNSQIMPDLMPTGTFKQRVLAMITGVPVWDMNFLKKAFPDTHEKQLYRTVKELLSDGSIRFVGQTGRLKSYTTIGLSALPAIKNQSGQWFDLKDIFEAVYQSHYKPDGYWKKVDEINEIFLSLDQLFIVADLDGDEMIKQYREMIFKFYKFRQSLNEMVAIVDAVLNHPTMGQDPKLFKRIFAGNSPDPELKNEFRLWLKHFRDAQNLRIQNETAAESTVSDD